MTLAVAFATAPAVLVTLGACIVLLAMRVWCMTTGLALSRQVFLLLDGTIVVLVVLFVVLVVLRFKNVG